MERVAKQVIVMRKDLGMRKGKMIAQGAHASLKVLVDRLRTPFGSAARPGEAGACDRGHIEGTTFAIELTEPMTAWLTGRFTKVCVGVESEAALDEVVARANAANVPVALIVDAGKTEFHGVPTKTCCAIGPAWSDEVDAITGDLALL